MTELAIQVSDGTNSNVKVITLTGEMDEETIESLKNTMDPLLADFSFKYLLFDLTNLEFINSKGIGYLVSIHTHLSKDQRELVLAGANEAVMDVISLVGLTTIIKYFNSVEEAAASL